MGPMNRIPIIALLCILAPCIATAQDNVLQAGSPTFTTAWPVTLGFIDVSNGNLHLEIPLGTFPQRAGRTFTARLAYDSRIWQPVFNGTTTVWQPTNVANSQGDGDSLHQLTPAKSHTGLLATYAIPVLDHGMLSDLLRGPRRMEHRTYSIFRPRQSAAHSATAASEIFPVDPRKRLIPRAIR